MAYFAFQVLHQSSNSRRVFLRCIFKICSGHFNNIILLIIIYYPSHSLENPNTGLYDFGIFQFRFDIFYGNILMCLNLEGIASNAFGVRRMFI